MPYRVVFFGVSSEYSLAPLRRIASEQRVVAMVESAPPGETRRSRRMSAVQELFYVLTGQPSLWWAACKMRVPYFYYSSGREKELAAFLKALAPDVCCVAAFNQLFPPGILQIPRLGFINFHPSLLPRLRGPNAWFWYYHQMETLGGATIHFLDDHEDTGDILKQASFPIPPGMPPHELQHRIISLGCELLSQTLAELEAGSVHPVPQRDLPCPQRARRLRPGEELFNWQEWDLQHTYHFLNGAYSWYRPFGKKYGLFAGLSWKAVSCLPGVVAHPGQIRLDGGGVYFAHPQGKVYLSPIISVGRVMFGLLLTALLGFALLLRFI